MNTLNRFAVPAARILFGLIFFVFGLNGFLSFLPVPEVGAEAKTFLGALVATGYMLPLIKGTEVVAGLMLLSNRFVPLGLILLAPVVVNIALFNAVLAPSGIVVPLILLVLQLGLAYAYRDSFCGVLRAKATPQSGLA